MRLIDAPDPTPPASPHRWRTLYRTCWALKPTNYMRASSENHRITLLRPVLNGRNTPTITVDTLS
jgi:hypothetical protein